MRLQILRATKLSMKKFVRRSVLLILAYAGINWIFRRLNRNKSLILFYHGVRDGSQSVSAELSERHLAVRIFREQLEFLKKKNYRFITLNELGDSLNCGCFQSQSVTLTFDDGFKNVLEHAYPVMRELGAKGTIYVVSDLVDKGQLLWTDHIELVVRNARKEFWLEIDGKRTVYPIAPISKLEASIKSLKQVLKSLPNEERITILSRFADNQISKDSRLFELAKWHELKKLDWRVLEIGSHTRTHPVLTSVSSESELRMEIYESRKRIEQVVSREINHFCYPNGAINSKIRKLVEQSGYQTATTTESGLVSANADRYALKRIVGTSDMLEFAARTSGSYSFFKNAF